MVIRVLDHLAHCHDWKDGDQLYRIMRTALLKCGGVVVAFDGVDDVPSSFVNGAFVKLLESYSFDEIKAKVRVINSTRQINGLIKKRLESELSRAPHEHKQSSLVLA